MNRTIRIVVLGMVTPTNNVYSRLHWRMQRKLTQEWSVAIWQAVGCRRPAAPFQRATVRIERHQAGAAADDDNLHGGAKACLDALVTPRVMKLKAGGVTVRHAHGLGFIVDDSPDRLRSSVISVRCPRSEKRTVIVIEEVT